MSALVEISEHLDMNNNEGRIRGIFEQRDGTWEAMTYHHAKVFKTRKGAERWFERKTGKSVSQIGK